MGESLTLCRHVPKEFTTYLKPTKRVQNIMQYADKLRKGTINSSLATQNRATDLARAIGAYHIDMVGKIMILGF